MGTLRNRMILIEQPFAYPSARANLASKVLLFLQFFKIRHDGSPRDVVLACKTSGP